MPRYLIAEPSHSGHVFVYMALLARYAKAHGYEVDCLVSHGALGSAEFGKHLAPVSNLSLFSEPEPLGLDQIARASNRIAADVVVIPNGDLFVADLARSGWRGSGILRVLVMRDPRWETSIALPRYSRLTSKRVLLKVAAARGAELVWLRQPGYSGTELHANDPVISQLPVAGVQRAAERLRESLKMGTGTYWFGMVGSIGPHKNLPLVLDSLRLLRNDPSISPFGFALLGPRSPTLGIEEEEVMKDLRALSIPIRRQPEVMTNDEMNVAVAALDCFIMAYSTSSPNSTLAKAAAFGTNVAAAGGKSIRRFVSELGMGQAAPLTSEALASLLAVRMKTSSPPARPELLVDQFSEVLMAPPQGT